MKISTKGRYALRLMIDLASHDTTAPIALKHISARQGISMKYLEQIVTQLCKSGFVKSERGPQGGYRLTREPKNYTAGEILRITEGSLVPVSCMEEDPRLCTRYEQCPTIRFWEGLGRAINEYVDSVTLEDLVQQKTSAQ